MTKDKEVLTTGDIAKYCGVHFRTVSRWIQKGHLKAFHLPGRGDSRVFVKDFIHFLKSNNIEIPDDFKKTNVTASKALIVEDDLVMARSIKRTLQTMGLECEIASDGFRAGAIIGSSHPSLITLDLNMPGLGGMKVLEIVRSLSATKESIVLVISGMEDAQLKKAISAGANAVLKKPFNKTQLEDIVKKLIN